MRCLTTLAITAALIGAAMLWTSRTAAASPAGVSYLGAQATRECGGGGGGGEAAAAAGMAGPIMAGRTAEEVRAAADKDTAIAQYARRHRSHDPHTQPSTGRGGQVYNCP